MDRRFWYLYRELGEEDRSRLERGLQTKVLSR